LGQVRSASTSGTYAAYFSNGIFFGVLGLGAMSVAFVTEMLEAFEELRVVLVLVWQRKTPGLAAREWSRRRRGAADAAT
jgi:hypothetical protein